MYGHELKRQNVPRNKAIADCCKHKQACLIVLLNGIILLAHSKNHFTECNSNLHFRKVYRRKIPELTLLFVQSFFFLNFFFQL